ncbi:transmembrane protein 168-A [Aplysia californica]|uniref:Transmembrane protein 168 n=1 Tax=Aplysia californica TaxID=6500 RepID=A0ABM1ABL9_APLCA|nr:transmembrane protein 168-A [Aplysia californica]
MHRIRISSLKHLIKRKRCLYYKNRVNVWSSRALSRIKYFLVHMYASTMAGIKNTNAQTGLVYFRFIPEVVLVVALGLGLYTQWSFTEEFAISLIAILGAFVFAISIALQYYFGMDNLGRALFHVWVGCLIGILAFSDNPSFQYVVTEEVMEATFVTSMVLGWCWNILERLLKLQPVEARLLTISEGLESVGLIIASLVKGVDSVALSLYTLAYIFHISAMRLKSIMGLLSFLAFIFVGIFLFFPALQVKPNIYALTCFVGRHAFQAVIDFYFCGLSMIDRWRAVFNKSRLMRYLFLFLLFLVELVLVLVVGQSVTKHKEWYIVLPLYMLLGLMWLMFHLMTFLTCWKLMGKVTECNASADERRSFNRIMAAKGLRYFGLVSQRIIFVSLVTTILVFAVGFETRTPYSLAMTFIVVPLEAAVVSLFWELGDNLGGTCTGYAVIAPVTALREGKGAQLLTSADVQGMSERGTTTLNHLQQLFTYHMVQNFGCDYSSSGLELDNLHSKLKAFFERRTSDGPRFDTYLLYYSGDVFDTGDWALSDGKNLSLAMLLKWWEEQNRDSGSRLILLLDTQSSFRWAQSAPAVSSSFLAVQSCRYINRPETAEEGDKYGVGSFTRAFVQFNNGLEVDIDWSSRVRPVRALYRVSRSWAHFSFHLPTREDFEDYWRANFPPVMKPLMKVLNLPSLGSPFCCCRCVLGWLRRLMMRWLPPQQLDTGHGLQLLNT